jgi:3-methyl-2-oxobutanoate hydroxymethyltransferase
MTSIKIKSVLDFQRKKQAAQKITMLTCYDSWSAQLLDRSRIDCLLIGDSVAMVQHGHKTTIPATVNLMALHCQAVARSAPNQFLIGDLPFMSYRKSFSSSVKAAETLMRTGIQAIKLEGAEGNLELIQHLVQSGIPVMGHIGLTPQAIYQMGGFKVQGKSPEAADNLKKQALALEQAGCFSVVLECVPAPLAEEITQSLAIPTIGIGAGANTDGQVLVLHDLLGLNIGFKPRFVRTFLDGANLFDQAIESFIEDVEQKTFPTANESYL